LPRSFRAASERLGVTRSAVSHPYIARAELVPLLEKFCPPFPGFYLYYPNRRNVPLKLRVLVDYLRKRRR
jgi:DNA-binding transcriptional LysR family regulator